ncbi:MFS transporter [Pararhizobium mangrovi]|uniref:MFS transporter n=1 Tax=Pararhizobium mangrovi TaxID=2590452 RepID=A0A506U8G2_9HYPH|nr:MFS transporter [Pararhizobium mangrovi]TPW30712.1 MFS transporter [Pararhizobium mangrovi]
MADGVSASEERSSGEDLFTRAHAPYLVVVFLSEWLIASNSLVTATILPSVGASFSAYQWFGWVSAAFAVGIVTAAALSGVSAERLGLAKAMTFASALFAVGCMVAASANGIGVFIAGRAMQGLGAGWLGGLGYVVAAVCLPGRHLSRIFAISAGIWGIATIAGPLFGGIFADAGFWPGVFVFFAAQAAVLALLSACLFGTEAESAGAKSEASIRALIPVVAGIVAIASAGVVAGVAAAIVLALSGLVALALAVRLDQRARTGLLPADLSRSLAGAGYVAYGATSAAGVAFSLYTPTILVTQYGLSAVEAGYVGVSDAVAWTIAAFVVSRADEARRTTILIAGSVAIAVGVILQAVVIGHGPLVAIVLAGAVMGAGFGSARPVLGERLIRSLDAASRARGSGAITVMQSVGTALGAAVAGIAANAGDFESVGDRALTFAQGFGLFASTFPFALVGIVAVVRFARLCHR